MAPLDGSYPSQAGRLSVDYCTGSDCVSLARTLILLYILCCRWWVLSLSLVLVFLRFASLRGVLPLGVS